MRKLVPVLVLITLGACSKRPDAVAEGPANSPPTEATASDAAEPPGAQKAPTGEAAPALSIPKLAYIYDYAFALPADRIERALDYDQQACVIAGPTVCQLLGSGLSRSDHGRTSGHLEVQATSAWIDHFRAGAADEAKAAGGRVDAAKLASEDLSRSIVDTDAAVRAKTALRDRLQQLLAERRGKLSDVMDVEHELTQAQADLDATTSELAVMRGRVAMSKLTIAYIDLREEAADSPWRPLHEAAGGFLGSVLAVTAGLLTLAGYLLPLGLAIGGFVGLAVWVQRRRRPVRPAGGPQP